MRISDWSSDVCSSDLSIMVRTSAISSDNASMTATGRISDSAGSLMVVWQDARFGEVIPSRHDSVSRNLCGAAAVNSYIGQPDEAIVNRHRNGGGHLFGGDGVFRPWHVINVVESKHITIPFLATKHTLIKQL